jgi:2-iminobutanoate/2-iminopropanoate deaminase
MGELPDGSLEAGAYAQATRALANLDGVLSEWATSLDEAVKITVFLVDWDRDYPEIKRALDERLAESRPARSTVEIRKLAMGGLVEIEAIVAAPVPD